MNSEDAGPTLGGTLGGECGPQGHTTLNSYRSQTIMVSKIPGDYHLSFPHRHELGVSKVMEEREGQSDIY